MIPSCLRQKVILRISGELGQVVDRAARQRHMTPDRVVDEAIHAVIEQQIAIAALPPAPASEPEAFDANLLEVVFVEPFTVARYDGRIAGIGVEIRQDRAGMPSTNYVKWNAKGSMVMDWAPWFVRICRCGIGAAPSESWPPIGRGAR